MADYRDTFTSEIYVNQTQAQDAIEIYTKKLADLNKQLAEIDKSEEGWEKQEKKLQRQIKSTEGTLKGVQTGVENFQKAMNSLDGRSINNLIKLKKQLNAEIRKLVPGTEEYINRTKDLKKVEARINSLTNATKSMGTRISAVFSKYWNMFDTLSRTITGLSMKFRQAAEDAAKLDDVYADVMKTTGLLHEEVKELDKELLNIDTRTSREQLLLLARDAGKLGIQGKENILGFVRAADQIQVALGEDLGEGAIRNLGKIADVLGYTKSMGIEKSLLSIASAVNAVGQASTASEGYLVDFTQRLAGVAAQTNISAADIIGFASGLDQSAMKVEMAATAFQKFLMKLYEDPAKFAEYANMEVKEFTDLLANDANTAIITVLKALKDQDGFASLVPIFKDMGLDGARAVSVLAAMATNINAVTEAQELANKEFEKATSVTEEYTVKNNNLQAQLEKARKEFKNASITLGQSLNPVLLKSTKGVTYLVKALASYGKEIKTVLIVIAALTVALKARNAAVAVGNAAMKVANALQATGKVITLALSVAYNTFANNTARAAAAQKMLNATMSASVFGVILTAVTALTVGIMALTKRIKEARKEREWLNDLEKEASVQYANQASDVKALTKIVHNNNISLEERKRALDELKKIVPDYHADLTEEGRLIRDNTAALDDYLDNLKKTVRMEIFKESYRELQQQMIEQEKLLEEAKQRQAEALKNAGGNTQTEYYVTEYGELGGGRTTKHKTQYGEATDMVEKAEAGLKKLQEKEKEIEQQIGVVSGKVLNAMDEDTGKVLSAMDEDIAAVNKKYEQLFQQVEKKYVARPKEMEERISDLQKQKDEEIRLINEKYAEMKSAESNLQTKTNAILTQSQFDYLKERSDKLTKKEKEMVAKEYAALTEEESKALAKRYAILMKSNDDAKKKAFDAEIKEIENSTKAREREEKLSLLRQEIDQAEYESHILNIKAEYFQKKIDAARKYSQDETAIMNEFYEWQIANIEKNLKQQQELNDALAAADRARRKKKEDEEKQEVVNSAKRLAKEQEILEKDLARVKERIGEDTWKEELAFEMWKLEELHQKKLISERTYQEARLKIQMEYASRAAEQLNAMAQYSAELVASLKDYELAKAEATYQAELAAAGDSAEQREAIETNYEKRKLDIQKKYADAEMAINIAKAIADGALAIARAFADMPYPAALAVSALLAVTTAAQVATIVQQRNAIKSSKVNTSKMNYSNGIDSTTDNGNVGSRVITGYSEGGHTRRSASDNTPVGIVHANEWVAPAWLVRDKPTIFANLEQYRKTGGRGRNHTSRGFADGGYTTNNGTEFNSKLMQLMVSLKASNDQLNRQLADGIHADVALSEINRKQKIVNKFKQKASL